MFDNTKKQKLASPIHSPHVIHHSTLPITTTTTTTSTTTTTTYMEWSFHPTDTNFCNNISGQNTCNSLTASTTANTNSPITFFNYDFMFTTDKQQEEEEEQYNTVPLPTGWTLAGRKRSIFELDTNIHTLSELYSTLVDLRNQLPGPVADQVEQPFKKKPSFLTTKSSTEDYMSLISRSGSSSVSSPLCTSTIDTEEENGNQQQCNDDCDRLHWTYPDFIFELLVQVYLDCICFTRVQPKKLLELHRKGNKLDKAYTCAIYAYASLHALLCHPEKFGIYSFMNQLALDAYQIAFDLVEFDSMETVTCETLVIMYQYLMTVGQDGEARNLFCLAQRQMELLLAKSPQQQQQDVHRLYVWMAELDWSFALTKFTTPLIEYRQLKISLDQIKPIKTMNNENDRLYVKATKFRIKGLHIILSSQQHDQQLLTSSSSSSSPRHHQRLNRWRTKYIETFLYKRHSVNDQHQSVSYTLEDKLALRLHALYFAGMLELHQQHMLKGFESDQLWELSRDKWPDYFSHSSSFASESSFEISNEQAQVEKGLYRSMNAAYGFIQVIRLLLDEMDRCILPQVSINSIH